MALCYVIDLLASRTCTTVSSARRRRLSLSPSIDHCTVGGLFCCRSSGNIDVCLETKSQAGDVASGLGLPTGFGTALNRDFGTSRLKSVIVKR